MNPAKRSRSSLALRGAMILLSFACAGAFSGCNAGVAAIAILLGLDDDDGGGSRGGGLPGGGIDIAILDVENARLRPSEATIVISLTSPRTANTGVDVLVGPTADELEPATVAPSGSTPSAGGVVPGLQSTPGGTVHRIRWNAPLDVGDGFHRVVLRVSSGTSRADRVTLIGNDAPEVSDVTVTPVGEGELELSFLLTDAAGDPTTVDVDFSNDLDAGGAAGDTATITEPTAGLATSPAGTRHTVTWRAGEDLGLVDRTVRLVLTPQDVVSGVEGLTGESSVQVLELDLNAPPVVELERASTSPDRATGVSRTLELLVQDAERDPVDVILQWAHPGEGFPEIPESFTHDPAAREAALADPAMRRELQIATIEPRVLGGPIESPQAGFTLDDGELLVPWIQTDELFLGLSGLAPGGAATAPRAGSIRGATARLVRAGGEGEADERTVCDYDPERAVITVDSAFDPPAQAGDRLEIARSGLVGLSSASGGVIHHLIWATPEDLPGGGEVRIRLVPFDIALALATGPCREAPTVSAENAILGDRGDADTLTEPIALRGPFGRVDPREIELAPTEEPQAVEVADLDGDGRLDIIVGNDGLRSLVILQQSERGFFDLFRFLDARLGDLNGTAVADLDNDGDQDVVLAGSNPSAVALFFQEPGFDFATHRTVLSAGESFASPSDLVAGDFDGDGDIDIAVSDADESTAPLVVFYRDGGAAAPCDVAVLEGHRICAIGDPAVANRIESGDIDADGRIDLVTANANGFTVYFGSATGFGDRTAMISAPGLSSRPLAVDDFEGDGEAEIASVDSNGRLVVARRTGGETFTTTPRSDSPSFAEAADLELVDLDAHAGLDFVVADRGSAAEPARAGVAVALSDSSGSLSSDVLRAAGDDASGSSAVAVGDIDGDGRLDIVSAGDGANVVRIFFQDGAGSFRRPAESIAGSSVLSNPEDLIAGDFDGDGRVDLLTQSTETGVLTFFRQAADRSFASSSITTGATNPLAIAAGDIDGDARPDIAVANVDSDTIVLLFQETSGFTRIETLSDETLVGPEGVALGDLDGDGKIDVIASARVSGGVFVFRQGEDGEFTAAGALPGSAEITGALSPLVVDLDRDGHLDVIVAAQDAGSVVIWRGAEGGTFLEPDEVTIDEAAAPIAIDAGDLDGDGFPELAIVSLEASRLSIVDRAEDGTYATTVVPTGLDSVTLTGLAIGDFDRNGRLDIAIGSADSIRGSLYIFLAPTGGEIGDLPPRRLLLDGPASITGLVAQDLDGDGEADLAAVDRDGSRLLLFRGGR